MRYLLIVLSLLLVQTAPARAEVSVGIDLPGISIGINMPAYPRLVRVPGYPVYYDPGLTFNYFFYDGLYWVFVDDDWYASSWYNGPWRRVERDYVPLYVLRLPVRYYRRPPPWFHGWRVDEPPHWHEHWGLEWHERHRDWDKWDRRKAPRPAPLPAYQKRYYGERYPAEPARQRSIQTERYRYQPRDDRSRRYYDDKPGRPRAEAWDKGGKDKGGRDKGGRDDKRGERGRDGR